jgi:hypothetical protein
LRISAIKGDTTMVRLAAAGRHDRQHVAAVQNGADDVALPRPEGLEAEGGAKNALRRREVGHDGSLGERSIFVPLPPQAQNSDAAAFLAPWRPLMHLGGPRRVSFP